MPYARTTSPAPATHPARRRFLAASAAVGGGLVLGFHLPGVPGSRIAQAAESASASTPVRFPPNAFIRIAPDESVTIQVSKLEFGQGVMTSLPMLVAEELECDWAQVRAELAPAAPVYAHPAFGIQMTGGSTSVNSSWDQLRTVGAQAREMLIAAAAQRWKVEPSTCRAERGAVVHPGSGRRATYGSLAEAAMRLPVPTQVTLKPRERWSVIGQPLRRLDGPAKVEGTARFGIDASLPDMVFATVARPPRFGATVARFDPTAARSVDGVIDIVQVPSGVAVLARDTWSAMQGRDKLVVEWDDSKAVRVDSAAQVDAFRALARTPGALAHRAGDAESTLTAAATSGGRTFSAEYVFPYLSHAPMEPLNCVAHVMADRCVIHTGTQFQTIDVMNAAKAAGLKPEQVELVTLLAGGGFGRRANPSSDWIVEAVHVSRAAGRPVKVVWTREDDLRGGFWRPMYVHRIQVATGLDGLPTAWKHTVVGQSILAGTPFEQFLVKDGIDATSVEGVADLPYAIPHQLAMLHSPTPGIPVLWWRSVGHTHTAFAVETMLDELATAAGIDPVAYRLKLLDGKDPRWSAALKLAAEKAGWGRVLPAGRAMGVAVHESFGSVVAQVVEASLEDGVPKVHRVTAAVHCGTAVNPLNVEAQIEGAIAYGLSAALHGAITLEDGRVQQSNFDGYPVLRMNEMPQIAVHVVPSADAPTGLGEPGTPPVAPALANALAKLGGKRVRELPITVSA
jgi:isoquinoline 1-oxidoreductase beta subunit